MTFNFCIQQQPHKTCHLCMNEVTVAFVLNSHLEAFLYLVLTVLVSKNVCIHSTSCLPCSRHSARCWEYSDESKADSICTRGACHPEGLKCTQLQLSVN